MPPPLSWLAPSLLGSSNRDYLGTMHETTKPNFAPGGIRPCLVLWRGTFAYAAYHLPTVT
jgi:hypothetical protein